MRQGWFVVASQAEAHLSYHCEQFSWLQCNAKCKLAVHNLCSCVCAMFVPHTKWLCELAFGIVAPSWDLPPSSLATNRSKWRISCECPHQETLMVYIDNSAPDTLSEVMTWGRAIIYLNEFISFKREICLSHSQTHAHTLPSGHPITSPMRTPVPLDDRTHFLFPDLTHDLSLTGGKDSRDPWCRSLPFTSMQFTPLHSQFASEQTGIRWSEDVDTFVSPLLWSSHTGEVILNWMQRLIMYSCQGSSVLETKSNYCCFDPTVN